MIEVQNVSKVYSDGTRAVDNVNLVIRDNEFVSLIGPSGCGKTTLLKIIDGLLSPSAGQIVINGYPVADPGPDRGVVFQDFALMPWATVLENVAFGLEMRRVPRAERLHRAREQIRAVGLDGFADRLPKQLSGGMQQRVGLARALAVDPDTLLMDEPFGALDAQTRHLLQEDLVELLENRPKTVVFVTHDMDEAVYLSDRVVIMSPHPGRVVEELDVDIERPRGSGVRKSREFVNLTDYVWTRLRDAVRTQETGA
jgi:ABC-type nitrate/sulfonate/bicarbonate transport system ATPase subunit